MSILSLWAWKASQIFRRGQVDASTTLVVLFGAAVVSNELLCCWSVCSSRAHRAKRQEIAHVRSVQKPCFRNKTALAARLRLFFAFRLIEIGLAQPIIGVITVGLNAA